MSSTVNTNNADLLKILLIIVLIILIIWIIYPFFAYYPATTSSISPNEKFSSCKNNNLNMEQENISEVEYQEELPFDDTNDLTKPTEKYMAWGDLMINNVATANGSAVIGKDSIQGYTFGNNNCSMACCSDQWPVPFKLASDNEICKSEYVSNSYFCNDGVHNSGCLCMSEKQSDFIRSRGNNAN